MARTISQRELRNDSGKIMRELDEGETFIVTRNGTPVGELIPSQRQRFVSAESVVEAFKNAPDIDADAFFADVDRFLDQSIEPRG